MIIYRDWQRLLPNMRTMFFVMPSIPIVTACMISFAVQSSEVTNLIVDDSKSEQVFFYWNIDKLCVSKTQLGEETYQAAYSALIEKADKYLEGASLTVVADKDHIPPSGDLHDYYSIARYTWPDSTKSDGLPYINRDGHTNPEFYLYDCETMLKMTERVRILTLAWYFTDNKKYADAAVHQLRTWFLDKQTKMNPHLKYGQIRKGIHINGGNPTAVLDGAYLVNILDAINLLAAGKIGLSNSDYRRIKKWFNNLLEWDLYSEQGRKEKKVNNNTGTSYDLQILAYSIFCKKRNLAIDVMSHFPTLRIFRQIDDEGKQPEEINRTIGFGYSVSNISVLMNVLVIAYNQGIKLKPEVLNHFYKAVDYLIPFLDKNIEWPYQNISNMDYYRQRLCFELYRISTIIDKSRTDYYNLYRKYYKFNKTDLNILLYDMDYK